MPDCSASTAPVKKPVSSTTVSEPEADDVDLLDEVADVERPADRALHGRDAELHVLLDLEQAPS